MRIECSSAQLQGVRNEQQDRLVTRYVHSELIALVADGIGGHAHGGWAAEVGIQAATDSLREGLSKPMLSLRESVTTAFVQAHFAIPKVMRGNLYSPPGTTLIGGVWSQSLGQACIGSIGDSSSWLLREGRMRRLTLRQDISYALGVHIGSEDPARVGEGVEIVEIDLQPDDVILIASDGLDGFDIRDLQPRLALPIAREAAESLASMVLEKGSDHQDNASFIVIRALP